MSDGDFTTLMAFLGRTDTVPMPRVKPRRRVDLDWRLLGWIVVVALLVLASVRLGDWLYHESLLPAAAS